jgi:UDP-glucose:(heptosyl)LPS alpha-1,3-glucosyltransferase
VLLEAMASGLPVLTTDVCGYSAHVERAGAGVVLVSPFDQAKFNKCMAEMLVSPARAAWRDSGLRCASAIMAANDGGAEARMLESMATDKRKTGHAVGL